MKIFFIQDTEKFINMVENSRGDVIVNLPNGSHINLKQSRTAKQLFKIMNPGHSGLNISLSDSDDVPVFLRYMMEQNTLNGGKK